jgi:hypothetical protein
MVEAFQFAALWLALAVAATALSRHLLVSGALVEICVGIAAAAIANRFFGEGSLGAGQDWLRFLASTGVVLLTFLAGAELDPQVVRAKLKEVRLVGLVGFAAPFLGCAAVAHWVFAWDLRASLLAGVALSTTSMAVVYAVMLESGFNRTEFGKGILGACFVNDLGTVLALGLPFAPFTYRTIAFVIVSAVVFFGLPAVTRFLTASTETARLLYAPSGYCWCGRPGGPCAVVRQRSGPARLHRRDAPCGYGGQGSSLGAAAAHADRGFPHPLLLHPGWLFGFLASAGECAARVPGAVRRQVPE